MFTCSESTLERMRSLSGKDCETAAKTAAMNYFLYCFFTVFGLFYAYFRSVWGGVILVWGFIALVLALLWVSSLRERRISPTNDFLFTNGRLMWNSNRVVDGKNLLVVNRVTTSLVNFAFKMMDFLL